MGRSTPPKKPTSIRFSPLQRHSGATLSPDIAVRGNRTLAQATISSLPRSLCSLEDFPVPLNDRGENPGPIDVQPHEVQVFNAQGYRATVPVAVIDIAPSSITLDPANLPPFPSLNSEPSAWVRRCLLAKWGAELWKLNGEPEGSALLSQVPNPLSDSTRRLAKDVVQMMQVIDQLNNHIIAQEEEATKVGSILRGIRTCNKCCLDMQHPFCLADCGHCFCEPCLTIHIRGILAARLSQVNGLGDAVHMLSGYSCTTPPYSDAHQQHLLAVLRKIAPEISLSSLFTYRCLDPACNKSFRQMPVEVVPFAALLEELWPAGRGQESAPEAVARDDQCFDGLFLPSRMHCNE